MPPLSRWYIRTSLLYLLASLLVGLAIASQSTLSLPPFTGLLGPVYFHLFLVGWIMQLIFGVIFWLFPRLQNNTQQRETIAWVAWGLLNGGLLLRAFVEPFAAMQPGSILGRALVLSALMQWLAGMSLIVVVWPRAYTRKRTQR